jgi:ABC-type spermidine/putrescine transport system permease subunit I
MDRFLFDYPPGRYRASWLLDLYRIRLRNHLYANLLFSELAVIIFMVQLNVVLMVAPIFFMLAKFPEKTIEVAKAHV